MKTTVIEKGINISCRRVACNPCAQDEYEVVIRVSGEPEQVMYTLAGVFETDEAICKRVYNQFMNNK